MLRKLLATWLLLLPFILFLPLSSVHAAPAAPIDMIDPGNEGVGCDPSQAGIDLGSCITLGKNSQSVADVYQQPADLVNVVVRNLFIVAGIIIFFMIIYAGYQFIEKDAKGIEEAQSIMTAAVGGLVVMFVAYWIVRIIEAVTGMQLLSL